MSVPKYINKRESGALLLYAFVVGTQVHDRCCCCAVGFSNVLGRKRLWCSQSDLGQVHLISSNLVVIYSRRYEMSCNATPVVQTVNQLSTIIEKEKITIYSFDCSHVAFERPSFFFNNRWSIDEFGLSWPIFRPTFKYLNLVKKCQLTRCVFWRDPSISLDCARKTTTRKFKWKMTFE